ncbi:MAG: lipid-A-disaccharide synthase [Gammaproteobacteria bacterium]|nr:lipid-A-disaccharide synthase [Gammaproteobacteria bacterium]MDP6615804.1 lipid-A-disaccharide synthase [Gammaproteobacteria bacterium]MDP6695508.1 lipid-A-disaccharide synthase [Gammaproteobacteria bacterium]
MPKIAIIAGEASGDVLAGGLIRELGKLYPDARFAGVTGPNMRAGGCESWGDIEELAVMGLVEVIRHLPRINRFKRTIKDRLRAEPPDILIGVDAPDFNLGLEKFARSLGIRTVQYVCPSVWAWRRGRVKTIRAACDHVLCLLPIEPPFLADHDIAATFIGHPLADHISGERDRDQARQSLGLKSERVVALLPGSRRSEIDRLAPIFLQAARKIRKEEPAVGFVVAAVSAAFADKIEGLCRENGMDDSVQVETGRTHEVIAAADTALLASGTVALEAMLLQRPMVVAYKFAPGTYWFMKTFMFYINRFSLPNVLAGDALVPEFVGRIATPDALAGAVLGQLRDPGGCNRMVTRFRELASQIRRSADGRAAAVIAEVLKAKIR